MTEETKPMGEAPLVEKVARVLARQAYSDGGMERITDPYTPDAEYWNAQARAAINVVLEEAAKVADEEATYCEDTGSAPSDFGNAGRNDAARNIAAAIRAMKVDT